MGIVDTHLIYSPNHSFFEAFYWLPNENVDYDRFYIRTGAVETKDAHNAREYMENKVIPEFITWANQIISLPSNSPKFQEELHYARVFK